MQHKLLKAIVVVLGLVSATPFVAAKPAQATSLYMHHSPYFVTTVPRHDDLAQSLYMHHSPYFVTHKVRLTKTVTFHKVKVRKLAYQETYVGSKTLKKGSIIKVRRGGATWSWVVTGHGMRNTSRYFWVTMRPSSNWFATRVNKK